MERRRKRLLNNYRSSFTNYDTTTETRQSIIQVVDTENLKEFYAELQKIVGLTLAAPFPHITLFTTSTNEDKKQRGIGIYSKKDFEALNPQQVTL